MLYADMGTQHERIAGKEFMDIKSNNFVRRKIKEIADKHGVGDWLCHKPLPVDTLLEWNWDKVLSLFQADYNDSEIEFLKSIFGDKISNYAVTNNQISIEFMDKHPDWISWHHVGENGETSDDMLRKYHRKLNWSLVSERHKFNRETIIEFADIIDWSVMSKRVVFVEGEQVKAHSSYNDWGIRTYDYSSYVFMDFSNLEILESRIIWENINDVCILAFDAKTIRRLVTKYNIDIESLSYEASAVDRVVWDDDKMMELSDILDWNAISSNWDIDETRYVGFKKFLVPSSMFYNFNISESLVDKYGIAHYDYNKHEEDLIEEERGYEEFMDYPYDDYYE